MRLLFSLILVLSFVLTGCQKSDFTDEEKTKYSNELSSYAVEYMSNLKGVLIKNMQEGGPLKAVNVCSDTAMDMTNSFNELKGVKVKRVSFKNRNVENVPDDFEKEALNYFENLHTSGKIDKETNFLKKIDTESGPLVRFAKPILVEAPCLNCHGSETQISEQVKGVITQKYPNDKAQGYEVGDLRGLISVSKSL